MIHINPTDFEEEIGSAVVHAAFTIHTQLGPGLLETDLRSMHGA